MKPRSIALLMGQSGAGSSWRLQLALLASLLLHGLLVLSFQLPTSSQPASIEHLQLEVVLVNANNSLAAPQNQEAKLLAQTALQGGGDAEEGHASSPMPKHAEAKDGDALHEKRQELASMQRQQDQLLHKLKQDLDALEASVAAKSPKDQKAVLEKRQMLLDQLGVIENRISTLNERPRKRYVHPATREVAYARYYDVVKQRIEDVGTRHFPKHNGKHMYGHLVVNIALNADGRLQSASIVEPSGHAALDTHALKIIDMAMPMEPFDRRLRAQADQLVIVARFDFKQDQQLQTTLSPQAQ